MVALAGLVVAAYKTHQLLIVNLATIGAFLVALWFSLPTRYVIQEELDGAARRLQETSPEELARKALVSGTGYELRHQELVQTGASTKTEQKIVIRLLTRQ